VPQTDPTQVATSPPAKWTRKAVKRRFNVKLLRGECKEEELLFRYHEVVYKELKA
jgi:hypothetical protein